MRSWHVLHRRDDVLGMYYKEWHVSQDGDGGLREG